MQILPFFTSILDSWHTKLWTGDLREHVFSFSASGWQNRKRSKRMTRKANSGGSHLFSWVMGPCRAPPVRHRQGICHSTPPGQRELRKPAATKQKPQSPQLRMIKKFEGIGSLKLGNLWKVQSFSRLLRQK